MVRVLLIECRRLCQEALQTLIDGDGEMCTVAIAKDSNQALNAAMMLRPDVVLVDIDGNESDCFDTIALLRQALGDLPIVVVAGRCLDSGIRRALELGVLGYVLKDEGFGVVRRAMVAALSGQHLYSARVMDRIETGELSVERENRTRLDALTARERQLLPLLARGMSLKEACVVLSISYKTADKHKTNLMNKLDIHDRVELTRYAVREGLIEP